MKWVFRIIFVILLVFAGLVTAGYFSAGSLTVVRSTIIDAEPDDVFPYLNNLENYPPWAPLYAQIPDATISYFGAADGIGQKAIWKSSSKTIPFGSQEIIASEAPEFVQLDISLAGRPAKAFYGITEDEQSDGVIVLIDTEYNLGGFPYIQRLAAKRQIPIAGRETDAALNRLKTMVEMDVSDRERAAAERAQSE